MQDVILPLILSDTLPDDVLFFVFEEDWELWPGQAKAKGEPSAPKADASSSGGAAASSSGGAASSSVDLTDPPGLVQPGSAAAAAQAADLGPGPVRDEPDGWAPFRPDGDDSGEASRHATDLVRIVTHAARHKCGDFVWLGYQPRNPGEGYKPVTTPKLGFGSQLIALTKVAAKACHLCFASGLWKPHHIDMELKRWLCDERFGGQIGACYIWPPVGSYSVHASECDVKGDIRDSCWNEDFVCPGTHPDDDPKKRKKTCMQFVKKGHQVPLASLPDGEWKWNWESFWQVRELPSTYTDRQRRELRRAQKMSALRYYNDDFAQAELHAVVTDLL